MNRTEVNRTEVSKLEGRGREKTVKRQSKDSHISLDFNNTAAKMIFSENRQAIIWSLRTCICL